MKLDYIILHFFPRLFVHIIGIACFHMHYSKMHILVFKREIDHQMFVLQNVFNAPFCHKLTALI